ncbi:MAG: hypothetical protein HY445_01850 [Candidatus Niyogibacteria bacterium]|nr:hypothetical protein [Candidatus Niyogibacteria bacterium]
MAGGTDDPKKHIKIPIRSSISHLVGEKDRKALEMLVSAAKLINPIYGEQMNQNFTATNGVFDKSQKPYYYPDDLSAEELEQYIEAHPEHKEEMLNPFSVVRRNGNALTTVPYSEIHRKELTKIRDLMEGASAFIEHRQMKKFLKSRSDAFASNDYKESEIDWIHVVDAPIELTIGPYESYGDNIMGVKRDFFSILGLTLDNENKKVSRYQDLALEFDAYLGKKYGYSPSGKITPMVVMDEIFAAGFYYYSFVPMAYNLPNDADILKSVGSKKVFVKNIMDARFNFLLRPIAERILKKEMMRTFDPWLYFLSTIGHELSHGLEFNFSGSDFKELGSPLEEAKADIFGMLFLYFLSEKGLLDKEVPDSIAVIHAIDGLRTLRFDLEEAHAVGSLIQYQWLKQERVIGFDGTTLTFKHAPLKNALDSLGHEFFKLSQVRNYTTTRQFTDKWGNVLNELKPIIACLADIPIDIDPIFDW